MTTRMRGMFDGEEAKRKGFYYRKLRAIGIYTYLTNRINW